MERAEAARLETFMDDRSVRVGSFLGRVLGATILPGAVRDAFRTRAGPDHEAAVAAASAVTPIERTWLDARIKADGRLDPLERALLDFLAEDERR